MIGVKKWYVAKMRGVQELGGSAVLWVAATLQVTVLPQALIAADETPSTAAAPAVAPGRYSFNMIAQGHERRYVVHVPNSVPFGDGGTYPLVVALHGSAGNAAGFLDEANWGRVAEQYGMIVVAPEGLPLNPNLPPTSLANPRVWNSGQYRSIYPISRIDDVSFLTAVVDDVCSRWPINRGRVYLSGFSNGGAMAFRLAAERADRFTAMATVSGLSWLPDIQPSRSIPTLAVFGTLDPEVPMRGGLKVLPWQVRSSPSVRLVMRRWAVLNGCPETATSAGRLEGSRVDVEDHGPGANGGLVRVYYVHGQGHAWPGGGGVRVENLLGPNFSKFDATSAICSFFLQYSW